MFQTRAGLTALELNTGVRLPSTLIEALTDAAHLDAYAAREVLHHPPTRAVLSTEQASALRSAVGAAGLGAGALSTRHQRSLSESVTVGKAELKQLLRDHDAAPNSPLEQVPRQA